MAGVVVNDMSIMIGGDAGQGVESSGAGFCLALARAGLHVFERTLLEVTPDIYAELEDSLAAAWPGEPFHVGPFLRWGARRGLGRIARPGIGPGPTGRRCGGPAGSAAPSR